MSTPQIAATAGFQQVTKAKFWHWVKHTPLNVQPYTDGRFKSEEGACSLWKDLRTAAVVGRSYDKGDRYFLRSDLAA